MCTAVSYKTKSHYFGRNLDLERGYNESVVITPRNYEFKYRYEKSQKSHYALIGMATIVNDYPLYFEATNEKGLSMAGLNFPNNAHYYEYQKNMENIAPFELIPYVLSQCASVQDVKELLQSINIVHCNFSDGLPVSPLHWIIADKDSSITLECTKDGMKVYDNPFGVLTNNPTFDYHMMHMNNYMHLHEGFSKNQLQTSLSLSNYSLGMGAMGLPGDFSSSSRFVKTVFVKEKSYCNGEEKESVNQFFHILQAVAMPKGCVLAHNGDYEYTRYSSCCNTDTQVYYFTTYENMSISSVDMHSIDLNDSKLSSYPID